MGECVDMQGKKSGIPVMIWQKRLEFQTKKGITKAGIPTPSIGGGPLFSGIAHCRQNVQYYNIFKQFRIVNYHAHILYQHEQMHKKSTNKPRFGSVVHEIVCCI